MPWRLLFALVPPIPLWRGVPAFLVALWFCGFMGTVLGDVVEMLGVLSL